MYLAERYGSQRRTLDDVNAFDAVLVGVAQAVALIPGVSRSGITISTAMFDGFRREQAATFAFLLSAPIIAAAGGKQLLDIARGEDGGSSASFGVYAVGLVTAAIVGYAAIAFLIRYLRGNPLNVFIAYRIALGLIVLGLVAAGVL
jgi:undecaprenyl-diphosphatase